MNLMLKRIPVLKWKMAFLGVITNYPNSLILRKVSCHDPSDN